jgi:hypothetical protein
MKKQRRFITFLVMLVIVSAGYPVAIKAEPTAESKGALNNNLPKVILTRSCIFGDIFGYAGCTSS